MNRTERSSGTTFRFLLISRATRSVALIFTNLSVPIYLTLIGYSVVEIGLLFAGMAAFSMLISVAMGMLGDRIGFRPVLILVEIPPLIALTLLSALDIQWLVGLAVILGGVGGTPGSMRGSFSPGTTAYIAKEWGNSESRREKLGLISGIGSIAAIGGGVLLSLRSLLIPYVGDVLSYRVLYMASLALMVISVLSLLMLGERQEQKKRSRIMSGSSARYSFRVMAGNVINGAGLGLGISILPLWWYKVYGADTFWIGVAFSVSYLATGIFSILASRFRFSSERSALNTAAYTRTFQGLLLIAVAFSPLFLLSAAIYVARSGIAGFGAPVRTVINVKGVSDGDYGTAISVQGLSMRLPQATSGSSGYLMNVYLPLPEALGGFVQMMGGFAYYLLFRNQPSTKIT